MIKRQVFYSFHYDNDVMRVQQIRNMGVCDGSKTVCPNEWEHIKKTGDRFIKKWIDDHMQYRSCLIVLIGEHTAHQKWVKYEISKAWKERKPIFGIYIHNLKCPRKGTCPKGDNPFDKFLLRDGRTLSDIIKCYDPNPDNAYLDIKYNINHWIEDAISQAKNQMRITKRYSADREIKLKVA